MGSLSIGSLFANRFEVDRQVGNGGMGIVYRARDRSTGGLVALKLLHPGGDSSLTERFAREAQLLSELRHPCIVSYIAHGQTPEGQRYLAMEWLDGEDLGQRLIQGSLPLRDCKILLDRISDALAITHQHGILHRDLKPTAYSGEMDRAFRLIWTARSGSNGPRVPVHLDRAHPGRSEATGPARVVGQGVFRIVSFRIEGPFSTSR